MYYLSNISPKSFSKNYDLILSIFQDVTYSQIISFVGWLSFTKAYLGAVVLITLAGSGHVT